MLWILPLTRSSSGWWRSQNRDMVRTMISSRQPKCGLRQLAAENDFAVDYITNTDPINDAFLAKYRLFIQLNYPPYRWTPVAKKAFERYITRGTGGWIGFHHAMLLGDFDGYPMWPWWSHFMGDIRYTSYIAQFATATVKVDDPNHPATKGLPPSFVVQQEEWYTWSKSNRANRSCSGQCRRVDLRPEKHDHHGRPSRGLDQRTRQGQEYLHLYGPSPGACFRTKTSLSFSGTPSFGVRASEKVSRRADLVLWDAVFGAAGAQEATSRPKVLIFYSLNVENRSRSLRAGCIAVLRGARPERQLRAGSNDQLGRSQ